MSRIVSLLCAICLLAACVAEPPAEPPPPLPLPPAPPRVHAQRAAPRPQPPATGTDANGAVGQGAEAPSAPVWRVAHDGVVGCADRAALDVLRQAAQGAPRLLAEARASGGCRTTFRVNEWALVTGEPQIVLLRMTNGGPLTLWFQRGDVTAP